MSYLEMEKATLPDMTSGIISLWFREVSKQKEKPPDLTETPGKFLQGVWPQGFWTQANASTVMVPPNAQFQVGYDPAYGGDPRGPPNRTKETSSVCFWNSYGLPVGGMFFGDAFLGPAAVWIPNSPPIPLNTMSATGPAMGGVADVDMSKYGIRTLLVFGDPGIDYNYCSWRIEDSPVIPAVQSADSFGFVIYINPPPYRFYYKSLGNNGKFKVFNYRLDGPSSRGKVAPSFIGIDNDGHIVINLQTKTSATYSGCSFEMTNIKVLYGACTGLHIDGPPYSYTQVGWPFPDGHWESVSGYWNGYEFEYKDISKEIMGCAPESFLIYAATHFLDFAFGAPMVPPSAPSPPPGTPGGGPPSTPGAPPPYGTPSTTPGADGGWHHLLFSFDIKGSVTITQPSDDSPSGSQTDCKAWLAFDDKNIIGDDLQNGPPVHDGFILPKLRGTQTTQILDCGPTTTFSRGGILHENEILPRNAWLRGYGNPKDGLLWFTSDVPLISAEDNKTDNTARRWGGKVGNFNWMFWTGAIWPLYGGGVAPGPWQATFEPEAPTVPNPQKTLDIPKYNCSEFTIPTSGFPIGIPCITDLVANNTGVEVAELQIWANKTLDTKDEKMRRLFLYQKKDKDGRPTGGFIPTPHKEAEKVLGKPDVMLHGSGNWKTGRNTGTAGGEFKKTGAIETFIPNPELGK